MGIIGEDAACIPDEHPRLGENSAGQVHTVKVGVQGVTYKMSLPKMLTDFRGH